MARVLYSASISEFKGSVKGNTFQRNSAGTIVKARNLQRFSPSDLQVNAQNRLGQVCGLWANLSPGKKDDWNSNAPFYTRYDFYGNAKKLSGFQWFQSCNNNMVLIGRAPFSDCPSPLTPLSVPSAGEFANATNFGISFIGGYDASNSTVVFVATAPVQNVLLSSRLPKRILTMLSGSTLTTVNLTSYWESVFGMDYSALYASSTFVIQVCIFVINHDNGVSSQFGFHAVIVPAP